MDETDFKAFDMITGEDITDKLKISVATGEAEYMWVRDVVEEERLYNLVNIFILPHYIGSLRYFDRMYSLLKKNNISVIYILRENEHTDNMIKYLNENKRSYIIHDFKYPKFKLFFSPFILYLFKKEFKQLLSQYNVKVVIQWNDCSVYNDIVDKACKEENISTIVLEWALTLPNKYFLQKVDKNLQEHFKKTKWRNVFYRAFLLKFIKILSYPLYKAFKTHSNIFPSYAAGNSDYLGVFNEYMKKIYMDNGVDEKKIRILGSFDYYDALNYKDISKDELKKKYGLDHVDYVVAIFSCPFYNKDFTFLTIEEHLQYVSKLQYFIEQVFKEYNKSVSILIKLHPADIIETYDHLENVTIIPFGEDNNELISLADICITQQTSLIESIIIMDKPVIDVDIVGLSNYCDMNILKQVLGIKYSCVNWYSFKMYLKVILDGGFKSLDNISDRNIIRDGKCYERIVSFIQHLILLTNIKQGNLDSPFKIKIRSIQDIDDISSVV